MKVHYKMMCDSCVCWVVHMHEVWMMGVFAGLKAVEGSGAFAQSQSWMFSACNARNLLIR